MSGRVAWCRAQHPEVVRGCTRPRLHCAGALRCVVCLLCTVPCVRALPLVTHSPCTLHCHWSGRCVAVTPVGQQVRTAPYQHLLAHVQSTVHCAGQYSAHAVQPACSTAPCLEALCALALFCTPQCYEVNNSKALIKLCTHCTACPAARLLVLLQDLCTCTTHCGALWQLRLREFGS